MGVARDKVVGGCVRNQAWNEGEPGRRGSGSWDEGAGHVENGGRGRDHGSRDKSRALMRTRNKDRGCPGRVGSQVKAAREGNIVGGRRRTDAKDGLRDLGALRVEAPQCRWNRQAGRQVTGDGPLETALATREVL